jgi:GH15 family glucan-1,4-alpha-glucosidase
MIWNLREPEEYYITMSIYDYGGSAHGTICVQNGIIISTQIQEGETGLPVFQLWKQSSIIDAVFARARACGSDINCSFDFARYYHYPIRVSYFNEYTIEVADFATKCPDVDEK